MCCPTCCPYFLYSAPGVAFKVYVWTHAGEVAHESKEVVCAAAGCVDGTERTASVPWVRAARQPASGCG